MIIKALSKIVSIERYRRISNTGWQIKIISPLSLVWNKEFYYIPQLKCRFFWICTQLSLIKTCAACKPGSVWARMWMWPKAKINCIHYFLFRTRESTKHKNKFLHKNLTWMKGYFSMQIRNRKPSRRVKLSWMNKFVSFSAEGKFSGE